MNIIKSIAVGWSVEKQIPKIVSSVSTQRNVLLINNKTQIYETTHNHT